MMVSRQIALMQGYIAQRGEHRPYAPGVQFPMGPQDFSTRKMTSQLLLLKKIGDLLDIYYPKYSRYCNLLVSYMYFDL